MIASVINIKQLSYETPISLVSSLFSLGILVALPIAYGMEVYAIRKFSGEKGFEARFGAAIDGLNTQATAGLYWQPITLIRWTLTNIVLVFLRDHYAVQIISFLIISVVAQALILSAQPFDSALDNRMNLFIEICVSFYLYAQLALTDFMGDNTLRDSLGWFLACLIISVVTINLLVLCLKVLFGLVKLIRKLLINYKKSDDTQKTVPI
jgi:hypothetical protein